MKMRFVPGMVLLLIVFMAFSAMAGVIRVNYTGNDLADGSTWSLAKKTVQKAMEQATAGDEIWVANNNDQNKTYNECFVLKGGVSIYGGFAGDEISRDTRNRTLHEVILSGAGKNNSVVEVAAGANITETKIDGFTIKDGVGKAAPSYRYGGGVYCYNASVSISNCTITNCTGNYGPAVYLNGGSIKITDSTISNNRGGTNGWDGIVFCGAASVSSEIERCAFDNPYYNSSVYSGIMMLGGTAMVCDSSFDNHGDYSIYCEGCGDCTIARNRITDFGGAGIVVWYADTARINGNVVANTGINYACGIGCLDSTVEVLNNTVTGCSLGLYFSGDTFCDGNVWNNIVAFNQEGICSDLANLPTLKNNDVYLNLPYGDYTGTVEAGSGDKSVDPLFADGLSCHLSATSPCIDKGYIDSSVPDFPTTDVDGQVRIMGSAVDIGADELAVVSDIAQLHDGTIVADGTQIVRLVGKPVTVGNDRLQTAFYITEPVGPEHKDDGIKVLYSGATIYKENQVTVAGTLETINGEPVIDANIGIVTIVSEHSALPAKRVYTQAELASSIGKNVHLAGTIRQVLTGGYSVDINGTTDTSDDVVVTDAQPAATVGETVTCTGAVTTSAAGQLGVETSSVFSQDIDAVYPEQRDNFFVNLDHNYLRFYPGPRWLTEPLSDAWFSQENYFIQPDGYPGGWYVIDQHDFVSRDRWMTPYTPGADPTVDAAMDADDDGLLDEGPWVVARQYEPNGLGPVDVSGDLLANQWDTYFDPGQEGPYHKRTSRLLPTTHGFRNGTYWFVWNAQRYGMQDGEYRFMNYTDTNLLIGINNMLLWPQIVNPLDVYGVKVVNDSSDTVTVGFQVTDAVYTENTTSVDVTFYPLPLSWDSEGRLVSAATVPFTINSNNFTADIDKTGLQPGVYAYSISARHKEPKWSPNYNQSTGGLEIHSLATFTYDQDQSVCSYTYTFYRGSDVVGCPPGLNDTFKTNNIVASAITPHINECLSISEPAVTVSNQGQIASATMSYKLNDPYRAIRLGYQSGLDPVPSEDLDASSVSVVVIGPNGQKVDTTAPLSMGKNEGLNTTSPFTFIPQGDGKYYFLIHAVDMWWPFEKGGRNKPTLTNGCTATLTNGVWSVP